MGFLELSNYACLPGKAGGSPVITRFYCIYSRLDTRCGENHGYQEEVSQKSFKAQGRQETESNGKEKTGEEAPCCEKENRSKEKKEGKEEG